MEIKNSKKAYQALKAFMTADVEELWVLALRSNKKLIQRKCIFRGTVDFCPMHPREVFRFAIQSNSSCLIIAHNHPSEDLHPSIKDISSTKQIIEAGVLMGIPVLDHLILGSSDYYSMADHGLLKRPNALFESLELSCAE